MADNPNKTKQRRRGHNQGSIFQRKDGRWCAVISIGYKDGKLQRKNYSDSERGK